jgi:hypothetical protein
MRVLWDNALRLPLERAKDKRHWGTKVLGFFVGYSESEHILPRNSYMFTLGEGNAPLPPPLSSALHELVN